VAVRALLDGLGQPKLPEVHVVVAAFTLARRVPIARAGASAFVGLTRGVTLVAAGRLVRARERPRVVLDVRQIPGHRAVAGAAASGLQLRVELRAVGILMTLAAGLFVDLPVEPRARVRVTRAAGRCLMATAEREARARVLLDPEAGQEKALHRVAAAAIST